MDVVKVWTFTLCFSRVMLQLAGIICINNVASRLFYVYTNVTGTALDILRRSWNINVKSLIYSTTQLLTAETDDLSYKLLMLFSQGMMSLSLFQSLSAIYSTGSESLHICCFVPFEDRRMPTICPANGLCNEFGRKCAKLP
uniref:Uncharacterized protein n=1 Tax=Arundo donax TaxID=35708 RepID=A0A0A9DMA9_ARUDO